MLDVRTRQLIAGHRVESSLRTWLPPGSTLKPFAIQALLESGKLHEDETWPCSNRLTIAGRSFNCIHPKLAGPVDVRTALAFSCNSYVAHFAGRFENGELARALRRASLGSRTRLLRDAAESEAAIDAVAGAEANALQALGEDHLAITPAELAVAYCHLADRTKTPAFRAILEGMEQAVDSGTGQNARLTGVRVAGKTGSSMLRESGQAWAWFAGFAPSRDPQVGLVVAIPGHSGALDAAPIAGRILKAFFGGQIRTGSPGEKQ